MLRSLVTFLFFLFIIWASPARADSPNLSFLIKGANEVGQELSVTVILDTGGQVANAAQAEFAFDTEYLEPLSAERGASLLRFFITEPAFKADSAEFAGGIPRPGWSGQGADLATFRFRAKRVGRTELIFRSSAILANDKSGSNILAEPRNASFEIKASSQTIPIERETDKGVISATSSNLTASSSESEYRLGDEPAFLRPLIRSTSHDSQNAWFANENPVFAWNLDKRVRAMSFSFDRVASADPGRQTRTPLAEKSFENVSDGIWYFHLRLRDDKKWGPIMHYRVMIDTHPPEPFSVGVKEAPAGEWPEIEFEAFDGASGVIRYEIYVSSLEQQYHEVPGDIRSLKLEGFEVGDHTAMIKAIDQAGNERVATVRFAVKPIASPYIADYTKEVLADGSFFSTGRTEVGNQLTAYCKSPDGLVASSVVAVDQAGNFSWSLAGPLSEGLWFFWLEAVNDKGVRSATDARREFYVGAPLMLSFGSVQLTYSFFLVGVFALLMALSAWALRVIILYRNYLRRETFEIEIETKEGFDDLYQSLDRALVELKDRRQAQRIKRKVLSSAEHLEEKIVKETKDVEAMLD